MPKRNKIHYKIAVCGASKIKWCGKDIKKKAIKIGKELASRNCILLTGATTGISPLVAKGAKEMGGMTIGLSPANSLRDQLRRYRLPIEGLDVILYTGLGYTGRNLLLTRVADGIIIVCGGLGTLNEFTSAFEDEKCIGVLEGTLGTADIIRNLIKKLHQNPKKVVFDKTPQKLVKKLINLIGKEKKVK